MKRREFLQVSAGLTGASLPLIAWSAPPCPPPTFGVAGGTSSTTSCVSAGGLPKLRLNSTAGAGTCAWSVGHGFRKGDAAASVSAAEETIQCDVRNRWSDGSVKFAVLSGVSSISGSKVLQLVSGGSSSGPVVAESAILTALGSGDVSVSLGTYGSVSLRSLVGNTSTSANVAGRVRTTVSGPLMSEFHYFGIPSSGDAHLRVWLYVRAYSNNSFEVETVVENGWFNVAAPSTKVYTPSVNVAGTAVFSPGGSVSHLHHTRWSRVDWVGRDPQLTPAHDVAYLRATRLVPNYGFTSPSAGVLDALFQQINPAPFTERGDYAAGYSSGGDRDQIGVLPNWQALWCTTGDVRAYKSVIGNARVAYRFSNFYRDELTLRAPRMATNSAYAQRGLASSGTGESGQEDVGASLAFVPATTGSFPSDQICDRDHSVQDYYLPYLISGRWPFMEAAQLKQMAYALFAGSTSRNYNDCRFDGPEIRGRGWIMRDCALSLTITPDDDPFKSELQVVWANNMAYLRTTYATPGATRYEPGGWVGHYSATGDSAYSAGNSPPNTYWWDAPWVHWFNVAALALAKDVEVPATSQAASDHSVVFSHYAKICSGIAGDGSAGNYNYRRAAQYSLPVGGNGIGTALETPFGWGEVWTTMVTELALPALPAGTSLVTNSNVELSSGDFDCSVSNFGHLLAALALAANHDAACQVAYQRLAASSTWASRASAWNNVPKAGIVPR